MTTTTRDKSVPDTIVLIHGLWMTALSWEHWVTHYSNKGYRVIARSWPGMEGDIDALRADPSAVAKLGVTDVVDHYEGIIRDAESRINWASHVDITFNLIRGCNPAPGAWTTVPDGKKAFIYESTKRHARTFGEVKGKKIGEIVAQNGTSLVIHGQGGFIEAHRIRVEGGRKVAASESGLTVGMILGG